MREVRRRRGRDLLVPRERINYFFAICKFAISKISSKIYFKTSFSKKFKNFGRKWLTSTSLEIS